MPHSKDTPSPKAVLQGLRSPDVGEHFAESLVPSQVRVWQRLLVVVLFSSLLWLPNLLTHQDELRSESNVSGPKLLS